MAAIYTPSFFQPQNVNGAPLAGAKLYFYQTGTTTLITVYQDDDASPTPHANPVVADASGIFPPIYVANAVFKTVLTTSADVTVQTVDPVYPTRMATSATDNAILRADGDGGGIQGSSATISDAGDLTITSTVADAGGGPVLTLYRNSASPAASDILGKVLFQGRDNAANTEDYAEIYTQITDTTGASEDASVLFRNKVAGMMTTQLTLNNTGATFANAVTFSGAAAFSSTAAFTGSVSMTTTDSNTAPLEIVSTNADATAGPFLFLNRASPSPAAADSLGGVSFRGRDSGGNTETYARILSAIADPTDASEDASIVFQTVVGGTLSNRMVLENGLVMTGATGGDKGAGTINAVGVYDDNVLLTDYVFDYAIDGVVREEDGEVAQAFAGRGWVLDLDAFDVSWRVNRHLPSMPSRDEWADGSLSIGSLIQRLWETVEIQAVHISALNERMKVIEAA
jgi:hypothetical protein